MSYASEQGILNEQWNAAHMSTNAAEQALATEKRRGMWAVIYGLVPYKDGDQWCVLLGENLQEGIAGFAETPAGAIADFDRAMGF